MAEGKGTIAVTGAARGIGAAIAAELARRGWTVGCLTRGARKPDVPGADAMLAEDCDVGDPASLTAAIDRLAARAGGLAGLVNNAGIHVEGPSATAPLEDYERLMDVNARAVFVGCRAAYPHLKAAGGTIVNIGSFFDRLGVPNNVAYCASKAAVGAITRCLAAEWAKDRIAVIDVAPGYVETDLNRDFMQSDKIRAWLGRRVPVGRAGQPDEVARLVASLFGEAIPYLTGETIYLDGGHGRAV